MNDKQTGSSLFFEDEARQIPFNGTFIDLSSDGKVQWEAEVKDGRINGIEKEYYPSGQIEQINQVKDNTICGISREFHENGKLMSECIVIRNFLVKSITYNEDGEIIERYDMPFEDMPYSDKEQIGDYLDLRIGDGEGIKL